MGRVARPPVRIGISGWTYAPWRGTSYPAGLPHRREMAYAAERLSSIEVNGSFYALQKPESCARWRDETPEHLVFSVKAPRFVTHLLRLRDARLPVANASARGRSRWVRASDRCCGSSRRPSRGTNDC